MNDSGSSIRKRRIAGIVSLIIAVSLLIGLSVFITWLLYNEIGEAENKYEAFKEYILSFGWKSRIVFIGIQILQVVVAFIPGEVVEVGAGVTFGAFEGTLLCMAGIAVASSVVFVITRKFGVRFVGLFIEPKKINELRFINSGKKVKLVIFLLFFIPGTPKDLFTYFAGLTRIKLHEFLVVSMLARIPSLVSSTIGGHIIGSGNWVAAVILFGVTGAVSLGGMFLYSRIVKTGSNAK